MKKYVSIFLAVLALSLAGCAGGPFSEEDVNVITIKAVMAENNTRTVIQDGTTSVLWEQADEIKVFYDGIGSRFANQNTSSSGTAKFSGSLNVVFGSNEGFSDSTPLWGLYPYRADATADNTSVTTTLPADQTGRAGSFAKGMNITLGKSSSLVMGFYNVCGGIRFSLTQEGVKEVIFEGQNNENIAGKVKLAFVDGVPAIQEVVEGQKTITLSAPYGQTFETGQWYYIVALPGTLSNGFKMTFNTDTQYATLKSSGAKTIKRGIFGSLADADEGLIYKDKEGGEPQTGIIEFADPAAKYACVAKYDTNGDSEVSIEEAEAATTFGGLFDDWKGVVSFDEIRYFKNVHSLNGVFNGCNKLITITVPENITDLGTYAFSGCSSLSSVELPSGISAIGNSTFQNCSSLTSIYLPAGVTLVGQNAFSGCFSLTFVDLPSGMITIANSAFQNCTSLNSIEIPTSVTSIGQYAFSGCSSLENLVLPDELTSIPASCFRDCVLLSSITWPSALRSIGNNAFDGCRFEKNGFAVQLPSSITSIGNNAFGYLHHAVLPSPTPISIMANSFLANYTLLYVPANMIEMYKVRTNWSYYAERIRAIDDYPVSPFTVGGSVGEAVDLGLSVKWSSCNVGAFAPEDYGCYFAWGETDIKPYYDWTTYKWCEGSSSTLTKYNASSSMGFVDNKTTLDPEDDVAHVTWGGSWRMPSSWEIRELINNCSIAWTTVNGVNGWRFTSNKDGYTDKSIFLPAVGYRYSSWVGYTGSGGRYWSSSLDYSSRAFDLMDSNPTMFVASNERCHGDPVRPVCD